MPTNDSPRQGLFGRFVAGLARTRQGLAGHIGRLFGANAPSAADLDALEEALIAADFGPALAQQLTAPLQQRLGRRDLGDLNQVEDALKHGILEILSKVAPPPSSVAHPTRPQVFLFLGINGSGKTTTIGKFANRLTNEGGRVVLAAADTFRAAAIEQLGLWGRRVGADVISHQAGADPSAVVFDAVQAACSRGASHLLIDTAGRLHTKRNLMEELKKIQRVVSRQMPDAPHERIMVLDATSGLNALVQAKTFHEAVGLTSLILTKLDGTAKGGVVVAIADQLKLPITYVGLGEGVDDLQPFAPETFTDALFASS
ncbi:cell division protein FtsY [Candidatus Methylomirabilis lanthanidiphila]|uniref:Signal recognition particle receptor FtsY n=1 Tax=Candidatus Methylomirabilis lanthanidiphila TaxID=2211376 RepID=A0A564ZGA3_9BACT|nr:signal recognition particle-docking protein FtsY [Candidatus Methylomirabilis lanthanidiphila]VUZ84349.1 cell division protein FtsY [Candidatus Methylomirabilis lanthanidiphila]